MVTAISSGNVLSVIAKENKAVTILKTSLLIRKLMRYIQTNRTLGSDDDVKDLARIILDEFSFLTLEEIGLSFRRAVLGECGDIYQLDPSTILRIVNSYVHLPQREHHIKKIRKAYRIEKIQKEIDDINRGYDRLRKEAQTRSTNRRPLRKIMRDLPGFDQFKNDYEEKQKSNG